MLKNLSQLLRGMKQVDTDAGQADTLSPPHERVLAKAWGLTTTDGLIPWAALEAKASLNQGWAFITPCHWAMGLQHATLTDPATLALNEADSHTLLAAMQPYFATEGITLHYRQPTCWLAEGEVFRNLPTASIDRVLGRNVDRWLPGDGRRDGPPLASPAPSGGSVVREATSVGARRIKLLQNEMQMLLYTHPVNDERSAKRQRSVNSFWVSGSGALNQSATANPQVNMRRSLAQAALADDWTAYGQAWSRLDANDILQLLALQNSGKTVRISLCGESNAMTFETAQHGWLTKIKNALSPQPPINLLKQL